MTNYLEQFFQSCYELNKKNINSSSSLINTKENIIHLLFQETYPRILFLHHYYHNNPSTFKNGMIALIDKYPQFSTHIDFAFEVLKYDESLHFLFSPITNHEKLHLAKFIQHPYKIKEYIHTFNKSFITKAIQINPIVYRYLPLSLQKYKKNIHCALSNSILYPEKDFDKQNSVFFDLPENLQNNQKILLFAIKYHPILFKNLSIHNRKNSEIIMTSLQSAFNQETGAFYILQNIVPYIDTSFFAQIKNIKWLFHLFEKNLTQISDYMDCFLSVYTYTMMEISKNHPAFTRFLSKTEFNTKLNLLKTQYTNCLNSKSITFYNVEKELILFVKEHLSRFLEQYEKYFLYETLQNKLSFHVEKAKLQKI